MTLETNMKLKEAALVAICAALMAVTSSFLHQSMGTVSDIRKASALYEGDGDQELKTYTPDWPSAEELLSEEGIDETGIKAIYKIPEEFTDPDTSFTLEYTGTKTYESTNRITYGLAGKINRAAEPDGDGFMILNGRFLVAIGTGYGIEVGDYFDIILKDKTRIPCIMGDTKADCDTDESNTFTVHTKCATEFIVKISRMSAESRKYGDVSRIRPEWAEKADLIVALDKTWDGEEEISEGLSSNEESRTYCHWMCPPARYISGKTD